MQLSNPERGSAVVEFVLLGGVTLGLFGTSAITFANSYIDTVARAIAIDGSRFAALADQQQVNANLHQREKLSQLLPAVTVTSEIRFEGNLAISQIGYQPILSLASVKIVTGTVIEK